MKRLVLTLAISLAFAFGGVAQSLHYDFEDGTLQGWTTLDGDGDGHCWESSIGGMGYNSNGMVMAYSKDYATGEPLTPNEYLVSPRLVLSEDWPVIRFYACALDEIYPAEHFGVSISTTVNNDPLAFTLLSEWTIAAKDARNRQGNWYNYTVDLSDYAGQEVYVAIRHHYCSGQSAICVDDIRIEGALSENFPLENTAWVQFYRSMYEDSTYYQLGIKGDTVVNEMAYKKVINCAHLGYPIEGECFGGIREDGDGKCYFMSFVHAIDAPWPLHYDCEANTEYPLYDFSLSVCDVFQTIGLTPHVVFDTTAMQLNGSTRKVLWFDNNCDNGNYYDYQWIEGIGSTHSLLYPIQYEPDNGPEYRLVEVWQDEELLYKNPHFEEDFPYDNTRWAIYYQNLYLDWAPYIQIGIKGDTVVDGTTYHKVIKCTSYGNVIDGDCFGGIRVEADGKWYFRLFSEENVPQYLYLDMEPNTERLIYDYSLSVCDGFEYDGQFWMSVFDIDEIEINGSMRRRLWFDSNCEEGDHPYDWNWIEGIGCNFGLLYSIQAFPLDGSAYHLGEVYQDGELIYRDPYFINEPSSFAPQGAEWYFNIFSFMNSPITYYRMAVEGDTLIQGHQCSVITRQYLGGNGDKQYVYEENDKVYWYNATLDAFTTLYDFDAEEGESWICHIDSCSYEVTVQSVEQVTWGGRTYRVQNIASVEGDFYERIIEGIGSVKGLFPYTYTCGGNIYCGPYPDYLRCYLVDGEMLYHEGDLECDAVLPWQYPCWDGTVAEAYDGGNGTAEDPYQIATPQQLALLAQQTNDGTGGDAYYLLTDDICLNANLEMWYINWKPIGRVTDSAVANFKGHFDGNGKTISKLLCETNEMMTDPVIGLFGCTDGAEIVNVNLSDCRLTGGEYAGGLVGYAGSTHISNCSVQNSQITTTGGVAGGIVGYAGMPFGIYEINENVSIITNCEINLVTVESSVDAGGIVGKVNDDSYYARYLISNCNANNEQYFHVKGSVSGGIVGEMSYGTIKGCASKTIVVGTGQVSNVCVGGIAGSIHGSTVIANSYNRGNVVADFEFAGGIVGYSAGNVYNVYNAGEIHMPDPNSSGYGTIIGNVQAGERLNCYWLENDLPSAGNPIQPDMPGSTAFHQGSTSTSWMLNEPQYDTSDLLEALNLGQHDDYLWLEDVDMANGGLPIPVQIEPGLQLNGSEWYYEILNADGSITYQYMYQAGDTIVQDEPTHILVKINTLYDKGEHQEVTHEYVYERDGKVYWWNKALDEFTVLYDLDAQQGDSWVIKVGTESLTMHVDAVEQYEYEGRIYKMLQVSDEGDIFSGIIVCGIGHLTSFFPERLMNRGKGFRVEGIRCYWRDSELVFKYGDKDCNEVYQEYHIGIEEDGPSTGSGTFTVYPNPTNGVLTIHHSALTTSNASHFSIPHSALTPSNASHFSIHHSSFRITNLMGQTLLTGQITDETQQINVSSLPQGMYFITVGDMTRKFVVNR